MNKRKLGLIIIIAMIILIVSLWLDPILFGGTWEHYVVGCILELACFIAGVIVGGLLCTQQEAEG